MNQSIVFLLNINSIRNVSEESLARSRKSLLDFLAVTQAGAFFQKKKLNQYFLFAQPEKGEFKVMGIKNRFTLKEAVFLNGLNSHALDYDDGTNSGIIHLGSPIFSLLLPLAQQYDVTVEEVLKAAIIGYEASYTMAVSIQPEHKVLGYHATGTCGVLGATLAASYMLGFTDEERFQAFATACVSASGMLMVLDDGSELKPYNVAKSALLALTSLQLAKAGFKGHPDPLGHSRGFLKMMTGNDDIELKSVMLNGTYAIMKSYTKPYASCRYTHPSVEAAIHLREQVKPEDIEEIQIQTYDLAVSGHDHNDIPGSYSAKMSIPYATAAGLIFGKAGLQEFSEETIKRQDVLALAKKVKVFANEELSKSFPEKQTAIVSIQTKNHTFTNRVDFPKGEPENQMTEDEFRERYDNLMDYAGIDAQASSQVYEMVQNRNTKVSDILRLL